MVTAHPVAALRAIYGVNQRGLATLSRGSVQPEFISRLERGLLEPSLFNVAPVCPAGIDPEKLRQAILTYNHNHRGEIAAFGAWLKGADVDLDAIDGPATPTPKAKTRRAFFASVVGGARG